MASTICLQLLFLQIFSKLNLVLLVEFLPHTYISIKFSESIIISFEPFGVKNYGYQ